MITVNVPKSAAYLRQSILLSAFETPEMRGLFNANLQNVAGKLRTEKRWTPVQVPEGIDQVGIMGDNYTELYNLTHHAELCPI